MSKLTKENLTMTICLYQAKWGSFMEAEVGLFKNDPDYVCVSEPLTVTFKPLDHDLILQRRVEALDNEITKVRAEAQAKIDGLKDQKQRLLAITNET